MSSIALMMLIVSIVMIWGGLALAIVNLVRHPEDPVVYSSADEPDHL
ncbi:MULTISPECIES: methionine/alanine import family NSS transporter small subunit [unclassified Rothia (in: high G+C Gram-positive bacteria)]|nr:MULTISPECIES: methionine/alanine import family NSS transporter small subunit [unclassified Rothia (in: high G+C Gram-positive bacteria)]MBM7051911.1 methionine/alanine import family NSS transporter small subunit [Rothia sp. ZJ1223]QRZ62013.1 methionine/alanine import family NSS transporter small subunit [Rothia sp. ZJ932]